MMVLDVLRPSAASEAAHSSILDLISLTEGGMQKRLLRPSASVLSKGAVDRTANPLLPTINTNTNRSSGTPVVSQNHGYDKFHYGCLQNPCHATLNITEGLELPENFPVGLKVLVVDDDYTSLSLAKKLLLRCEYDVTTCSEAAQALLLLREKGGFDLIMADIHIFDMDGINLLELFGHHMDLPVIMISADSRVNNILKGLMHGASGFLYKPLRMEELQTIWQFVIKKKWLGNKELGHSATVNDSDGNWQVMGVTESASLSNDATNVPGRPQEKKIDNEEDCDVGEPNSADPPLKKPRLSWSLELHQQFVNAVNQIGIDRAAPKRILDLMNVPGLTREKVASHLQKFRLQLKKLDGMAKQNAELGKFLLCASLDADLAQLGKLDSRTISFLKKITPEALAALQDMPEVNHRIQQQDSAQENNCLSSRQDAAFDQSLLKCNGTATPFPGLPANNILLLNPSNDSNLSTALQHKEPNVGLSELSGPVNAQNSYLAAPTQSSSYAKVQEDTCNLIDNFMVVTHQSSENFQPECITHAFVGSYLLSASSDRGNYPNIINHFSMKDFSHSLSGTFGENNPGQSSTTDSPKQFTQFHSRSSPVLSDENSMLLLARSSSTAQAENNLLPVNCNIVLNKDSLITNSSQLSLKQDNLLVRSANAIDEGFTEKSYSLEPDSSSIPLPFHTDGSNLQSPHKDIVDLHESLFVPKSCSIQATSIVLGKMIDQGQGRNSDVGKDEDAHNHDHSESGRML